MMTVRCDEGGDARGDTSAERGVGGVTIGSAVLRGGDRIDPPTGALCASWGEPDSDFKPTAAVSPEGKSTRPAAKTPLVMSLSRCTVGRAGLGLFASRSMRSAASVSTARVPGAFASCDWDCGCECDVRPWLVALLQDPRGVAVGVIQRRLPSTSIESLPVANGWCCCCCC